jgi:hypothetical protein
MWIDKFENGYIEIHSYNTMTGAFINNDIIKVFIKYAWENTFKTNLNDTTCDEIIRKIDSCTMNTSIISNCGVDYLIITTKEFNKTRTDITPKKCPFQL